MAYFANVYRISFDTLQRVKGSKDADLLRELRHKFPDDEEDEFEDDEERPPALSEAFGAIINDLEVDDPSWPAYSVACECIYARFGTQLESNAFCPSRPEFVEAVVEALTSTGLSDRVLILTPRESPLWPEPSLDFPTLSHMTPDEVAAARGLIDAQDWSAFQKPLRDALATVARWINEAANQREGLVCAYS